MPRLKDRIPKYHLHRQSGQAIVTLNGRDHLLGRFDTKASRIEYDRLIGEWLARGRRPKVQPDAGYSIGELASRYWAYATTRYVRHGRPTPEQFKVKTAFQHLLRFYEDFEAAEFGLEQLEVVRKSMIDAGWSRKYINQQVVLLIRVFKWAAHPKQKLVPVAVHAELTLVEPLEWGKSAARETQKVRPVSNAVVAATLPYLSPTLRAMVELQLATAMRPGELVIVRPGDVNRDGGIWEFEPLQHKGAHREQERLVCIGPRGQEILTPFLLRPAEAFCFSPAESMQWHRNERHERRRTPASCGNTVGTHRRLNPKRTPGEKFDVGSYRRAIHRACDKAFPAPADILHDLEALEKWRRDHRWSPHQLRHTQATRIRREFDIESAKSVLGHSATNTTGLYAEVDRQRAIAVARRIG